MTSLYKIIVLTTLLILFFSEAQSQELSASDSLPLDKSIRFGKLPNGFTYFIKSVPGPQEKLYLKLYSKAGSNQEDSNHLDIAHGLEHVAFRATENFPAGIHNYIEFSKIGMGLYDIYAFSGPKGTTYYYNAPHDNSQAQDIGLLWFKDIAMGLKLDEAEIHQVRGELRQEFLGKVKDNINESYANDQMESSLFNCIQDFSNYLEYFKTFDPEIMRSFYKDWYRPDLLALSVVGDISNIDSLEKQIHYSFGELKAVKNPKKLRDCHALYFKELPQFHMVERLSSESSNLIPDNRVDLKMIYRYPLSKNYLKSRDGIKRLLTLRLLIHIVNDRLQELTRQYNSFEVGVRDTYNLGNKPATLSIHATLQNTEVKMAVEKIVQVLNQLRTLGISDREWLTLKKEQIQYFNSDNENEARYWNDAIMNYYYSGEPLPANKTKYLRDLLDKWSLSDFNDVLKDFLLKKPEDIGIIAPEGHTVTTLSEKKVRKWIEDAYESNVPSYEPPVEPEVLMSAIQLAKFKRPEVVKKKNGKSGAREMILSNGVRLVLKSIKPTPGSYQDELKIHGFMEKGASCFPQENFYSAIYGPFIISHSGVNQMNKFEINRFLSKRGMSNGAVLPYIDIHETGIQATASLENLEQVLQLTYLYFVSPNKNPLAFEDWKRGKLNSNEGAPYWDFNKALGKLHGDNSVFYSLLGKKAMKGGTAHYKGVEKTDLEDALRIYKELFGNSRDFTFIISGDFDVDSVSPLLIKYLGNLPNISSIPLSCAPAVKTNTAPSGPMIQEISPPGAYEMRNTKYGITFFHQTKKSSDWKEHLKVEALGEVTTHKLWELRFKRGYSLYSVGMSSLYNMANQRYEITSEFDCVPNEFKMIRKEVNEILSEIKSGITEELLKEGMSRMYSLYNAETRGGSHRRLHQNLYEHYRYGQPIIDPLEVEKFVKSITVEDIVEMAHKYFKKDTMYEYVMKGEL